MDLEGQMETNQHGEVCTKLIITKLGALLYWPLLPLTRGPLQESAW